MPRKALVLDANILIRAVLGHRVVVSSKLTPKAFHSSCPRLHYQEAEEHLSALVVKRGGDPQKAPLALKAKN